MCDVDLTYEPDMIAMLFYMKPPPSRAHAGYGFLTLDPLTAPTNTIEVEKGGANLLASDRVARVGGGGMSGSMHQAEGNTHVSRDLNRSDSHGIGSGYHLFTTFKFEFEYDTNIF